MHADSSFDPYIDTFALRTIHENADITLIEKALGLIIEQHGVRYHRLLD